MCYLVLAMSWVKDSVFVEGLSMLHRDERVHLLYNKQGLHATRS